MSSTNFADETHLHIIYDIAKLLFAFDRKYLLLHWNKKAAKVAYNFLPRKNTAKSLTLHTCNSLSLYNIIFCNTSNKSLERWKTFFEWSKNFDEE